LNNKLGNHAKPKLLESNVVSRPKYLGSGVVARPKPLGSGTLPDPSAKPKVLGFSKPKQLRFDTTNARSNYLSILSFI
jgi:hypothetical protein